MVDKMSELAQNIIAGLEDAIAHASGNKNNTRTTNYDFADAKSIRKNLKLSQSEFAKIYGIPLNTLQNW